MSAGTVLHFAPHPDDELIGAPATLLALRDAGWRIVNVALSLGGSQQWDRRERELRRACENAGFELRIPAGIREIAHLGDGEVSSQERVAELIAPAIDEDRPALIVSPSRHDRHHGHEVVGRAVQDVLSARARRGETVPRWWMWGIWADLPLPTVITEFDDARLREIVDCLSAYEGELERNPYQHLVAGRAMLNGVVGYERAFGFGAQNLLRLPYAEVVTEVQGEVTAEELVWRLGTPRLLDPDRPLERVSGRDVSFWLAEPSITEKLSAVRARM